MMAGGIVVSAGTGPKPTNRSCLYNYEGMLNVIINVCGQIASYNFKFFYFSF